MRCLLLIALCLSSALALDLSSYQLSAARVKAPNVRLNLGSAYALRAKRDVRVHGLKDPDDCILNCTQKMHDGLSNINDTDSEEAKMTALCTAIEPTESCYKTCPDSELRKLMIDFLPLMKQPCLLGADKVGELKQTLNCLNSTSDAISNKCDALCNGSLAGDVRLESRILLNVDPAFVMFDDDKQENRDVLKSTCTFLGCMQQCGDSITKEKCGQKGLDVDHKLSSSIFGGIMNLYIDLGGLDGEVKECKALL